MAKKEINPELAKELQELERIIKSEAKRLELKPFTAEQDRRIASTSFCAYRLVNYISKNQGARTDHISRDIAIGNVSDAAIRANPLLRELGLEIQCKVVKSVNRYNEYTIIGRWFLVVVDCDRWHGEACNDAYIPTPKIPTVRG